MKSSSADWISFADYSAIVDAIVPNLPHIPERWNDVADEQPTWYQRLQDLGFRLLMIRHGFPYRIMVNHSKRLVIKPSYLLGRPAAPSDRLERVPERAVPTEVLGRISDIKFVMLQPLVDASAQTQRRVYESVTETYQEAQQVYDWRVVSDEKARLYGNDTHEGNFGEWNGQPVVFDW